MSYPRMVDDLSGAELLAEIQQRLDRRVVEQSPYDIYLISRTNRERCKRWHADGEPWTAADWSNALAGEVGELCNFIKKVRRHETGLGEESYNTPDLATLKEAIRDEIADVFLYLDLVAAHFRLNLYECIAPKFNRVSEAQDFPERLAAQ